MSGQTVYLISSGHAYDYDVERVYLDRDKAEAFVAAYNATSSGFVEIEERQLGGPDVAYDGPIWSVTWTTRRKLRGEKQLILVRADGFTTVVPNAVPSNPYSYQEYFGGLRWKDIADPDYEIPPIWIDSFYVHQNWLSGDHPGDAEIGSRYSHSVEVHGTSKEACEELVRSTAIEIKNELGIA